MITTVTSIWCDDCNALFETCIQLSRREMEHLSNAQGWRSINGIDRCPKCAKTIKK